jgi:hypothetical protein
MSYDLPDSSTFPEFRYKVAEAPFGRLSMHHGIAPTPSIIKTKLPLISSVGDSGLVGWSDPDLFFTNTIRYERVWLVNKKAMTDLLRWRPETHGTRMRILIISDESFAHVRLAPTRRYHLFGGAQIKATIIDEELFDRNEFEIFQISMKGNLSDPSVVGRLIKFIESLTDLGKRYSTVLISRFHELFDSNTAQPEKLQLGRDFMANSLVHTLDLLRFHTKQSVLFAGFNTRALTQLRVDTVDILRRRNPSTGFDQIYITDILSASSSVVSSKSRFELFEKSKLFLLRNLTVALLRDHAVPYFDPPTDGLAPAPQPTPPNVHNDRLQKEKEDREKRDRRPERRGYRGQGRTYHRS